MQSNAYKLGREMAKEAGPMDGLMHLLRRLGRNTASGFGRKMQSMQQASNPIGTAAAQAKATLQGRRFISPAEKLHRRGGTGRGMGAFAAEYPGLAALGGGVTLAQLNDMLTNAGQSSAIQGLQEQQA